MDKLNQAAHITDYDPVAESVMTTSNWYEWQECENTDSAQLPWLFAQGWTISKVDAVYDSTNEVWNTTKWYLRRRVLKPEKALSDLVWSFTRAYNDGRTLNDQRFDDIVSVYTVMLDKTEDACIGLEADDTTYDGLIETLITNITSDFTTHNTDVVNDLDTFGESERDRVDTLFDAKSAAQQADLIRRGMYTTTVWSSVSAGIERERAVADLSVEDKISEKQIQHKDRLYTLKQSMRDRIMAARDRVRTALHAAEESRNTLRNNIADAMLRFMERREDSYPDMASIGNLAAGLGASQVSYPSPG